MSKLTKDRILERYERAATLASAVYSHHLVRNCTIFPVWIEGTECFWYERFSKTDGRLQKRYRVFDASTRTNEDAFDHAALGAALADASGREIDAGNLPITSVDITRSSDAGGPWDVTFLAGGTRWRYVPGEARCVEMPAIDPALRVSPDGRTAVRRQGHDLVLCDLVTGDERPLTSDGSDTCVYGAPSMAWGTEHEPDPALQAAWSPDGTRLFVVQRDTRGVKTVPIVHHVPGDGSLRPTVRNIAVPYPGDGDIETLRLLIIDSETGEQMRVDYPQIPSTRNGFGFFSSGLGWWGGDGAHAYFIDVSRDCKTVRVNRVDAASGQVRTVFEEVSPTHIDLMLNADEKPGFVSLPDTNELLWLSERTGWAHLYLYDLDSGDVKTVVTQGAFVVRDVVRFDPTRREVFLQTSGRAAGRDPYYRDIVRVDIDTGEMVVIADSDHEYWAVTGNNLSMLHARFVMGLDVAAANAVSPGGAWVVVTRSRADEAPVTCLFDRDGAQCAIVEEADLEDLPADWRWPQPVALTAADKETDLYGLVYRPSHFSDDRCYPVILHVFATPELTWVPKGSFTNSNPLGWAYFEGAALAELGFIVVQIDSRGTPFRHKAFHDASYGWIESSGRLDDYVAGIRQLAQRIPQMDLDRVGISSHTAGGPGGVQGLLHYPEVFKVGVGAIFHDSRLMPAAMWGDKYEGLDRPAASHRYPDEMADRLKGKLLIMQGMLDIGNHPAGAFRLIEALQKANKDFDMLFLPNVGHETTGYMLRRAWDFFVRHLAGEEPPEDFRVRNWIDVLTGA